jgi:hypothetical protein
VKEMIHEKYNRWRIAIALLTVLAASTQDCSAKGGATRDDIKVLIYYGSDPGFGFDADAKAVQAYFQSVMFPNRPTSETQGIQPVQLDGSVTKTTIQKQIRDLNVAPCKTTVVVYFSTHGAISKDKQLVQIRVGELIPLAELQKWVMEKKPGLALLICDMCSSYITEGAPPKATYGVNVQGFEKLFLKPTGKFYTIMAASPGEIAWGDIKGGGCFTKALLNGLRDIRPKDEVTWDDFFPRVCVGTEAEYRALKTRYKDTDLSTIRNAFERQSIENLQKSKSQTSRKEVVNLQNCSENNRK